MVGVILGVVYFDGRRSEFSEQRFTLAVWEKNFYCGGVYMHGDGVKELELHYLPRHINLHYRLYTSSVVLRCWLG